VIAKSLLILVLFPGKVYNENYKNHKTKNYDTSLKITNVSYSCKLLPTDEFNKLRGYRLPPFFMINT